MVQVRLSEAAARRAGIDTGATRAPKSRRAAGGAYPWRCTTCGEEGRGETAATRHNAETHHARFACPVTQ